MLRSIRREIGQSMVEMAIVLPILLALVMGIIEFGNIYSHQLEVNNLARHSARTAVVSPPEDDDDLESSLGARMPGSTVVITRSGGDVTASVHYTVQLITGQIIGIGTKDLVAVATMKAE